MLTFYHLIEIIYYSGELSLMLQGEGNAFITVEEAIFKFDLGFTIFTVCTETGRSACFKGL
jgi:hypothetical protein